MNIKVFADCLSSIAGGINGQVGSYKIKDEENNLTPRIVMLK